MDENTPPSESNPPASTETILPRLIQEEMKMSYLSYAMSVIVSRAIPDVRDGLKPVHRRILFAMHDMGMLHNKPFKKSARIVGECLGKYHPHGDQSVYDALVRMAQDFSLRYPLVQGQGNFGSIDGDPSAAMRYTESRLNKLSEQLLADLDKDTVDFQPNFDASLKEPIVLPAKAPSLLINGSSGIAVGMATNIPPHNLTEVCQATCATIDNPEITVDELITHVKGPDFPTGGYILGTLGIKEAYRYGRGRVKVRAKHDVEESNDRQHIIITEIPYMVNKSTLLSHIADLVRNKTIPLIADIRDESDKDGMRIVITLKKGTNADVVANQLFKHSRLQVTFGINMLSLVKNEPKVLNLLQITQEFIIHRQIVVRRRTQFELQKAEKQAHILEGLIIALDDIDKAIALIKQSKTAEVAMHSLQDHYSLTQVQAKAILEMRLQRLTNLEQDKIRAEHARLLLLIQELREILADEQKILQIIKTELEELKELFGDERRTQILDVNEDESTLDMEDLIEEHDTVISITHSGYCKRLPVTTYRQQNRGGKGVIAANTKEEDFVETLFVASTHSYMLCFTESGQVHWLKAYQIPEASRQSLGKAIVNLLGTQEKINAILPVRQFNKDQYIMMLTKNGTVKRIQLQQFSRPRRGGIRALSLEDGDSLVTAVLTSGNDEILIATKGGNAVRCRETDIRPIGRSGRGVRGVTLSDEDESVGIIICAPGKTVLTITENGFGKRTAVEEYRLINRGGKGVINIKCSERNGGVVAVACVEERDDVMFISQNGIIIRTNVGGISAIGRNTQGVRLMRLKPEDKVVTLAKVVNEEEPDDVAAQSPPSDQLPSDSFQNESELLTDLDVPMTNTIVSTVIESDHPPLNTIQPPMQEPEYKKSPPTVQELVKQQEKPTFDHTPTVQELLDLKKRNESDEQ